MAGSDAESQPTSSIEQTSLRVLVPFERFEIADAPVPVQIRRLSTAFVAGGWSGEAIPVPVGDYLVSATLPGGEELLEEVTAQPGPENTVTLLPPTTAQLTAPDVAPQSATAQFYTRPASIVTAVLNRQDGPVRRDPSITFSTGTEHTVYLRLMQGNPLGPSLTPVAGLKILFPPDGVEPSQSQSLAGQPLDNLPLLSHLMAPEVSVSPESWLAPFTYQLTFRVPSAPAEHPFSTYWLCVTTPPDVTRYMAVPGLSGDTLYLVIARQEQRRAFSVAFHLHTPTFDTLLHLRNVTDPDMQSLTLERILSEAGNSPVHQTLTSLFALRSNIRSAIAPDRPPLLPDDWAIRGELLAREGEHASARDAFMAVDQLPLFSASLGYLSSRIPQYLRLESSPSGGSTLDESSSLRMVWDRLLPFVRSADFKSPTVLLRGSLRHMNSTP